MVEITEKPTHQKKNMHKLFLFKTKMESGKLTTPYFPKMPLKAYSGLAASIT